MRMYNVLTIKEKEKLEVDTLINQVKRMDFHNFILFEEQIDLYLMTWHELEIFNQKLATLDLKIAMYAMSYSNVENFEFLNLFEKLSFLEINYLLLNDLKIEQFAKFDLLELMKIAGSFNINLVYENNKQDNEFHNIQDYFKEDSNSNLTLLFNPANFLAVDLMPLHDVYFPANFKDRMAALLLKDGVLMTNESDNNKVSRFQETTPGNGNAQIMELISINKARSFQGMLIFEINLPNNKIENTLLKERLRTFKKQISKL